MAGILTQTNLPMEFLSLCEWNCNEMSDVEFAHLTHIMGEEGFDEVDEVIVAPEGDE